MATDLDPGKTEPPAEIDGAGFDDEEPEEESPGVDWKRVLVIALFLAASLAVALWTAALYAQPSAG
jgi:hypothetical protein